MRIGSRHDKADPQVDAISDKVDGLECHCLEIGSSGVRISSVRLERCARTKILLEYNGVGEVDHEADKVKDG